MIGNTTTGGNSRSMDGRLLQVSTMTKDILTRMLSIGCKNGHKIFTKSGQKLLHSTPTIIGHVEKDDLEERFRKRRIPE
ncbi:MAG: hypothetical protein QXU32_13515 [Nitrososphaerales archaeon]